MKVVPELVEAVKTQETQPLTPEQRSRVGTVRVDFEHLEQKTFRVTTSNREEEFTFLMDEPAVRGGQNNGPTPLAFFIAGAGG